MASARLCPSWGESSTPPLGTLSPESSPHEGKAGFLACSVAPQHVLLQVLQVSASVHRLSVCCVLLVMVWGSFEEAAIPGVGWLSFIPEIPEAARLSLVLLKPAVDKHVFHQLYPTLQCIFKRMLV